MSDTNDPNRQNKRLESLANIAESVINFACSSRRVNIIKIRVIFGPDSSRIQTILGEFGRFGGVFGAFGNNRPYSTRHSVCHWAVFGRNRDIGGTHSSRFLLDSARFCPLFGLAFVFIRDAKNLFASILGDSAPIRDLFISDLGGSPNQRRIGSECTESIRISS